jgi:hypothetical protein
MHLFWLHADDTAVPKIVANHESSPSGQLVATAVTIVF